MAKEATATTVVFQDIMNSNHNGAGTGTQLNHVVR